MWRRVTIPFGQLSYCEGRKVQNSSFYNISCHEQHIRHYISYQLSNILVTVDPCQTEHFQIYYNSFFQMIHGLYDTIHNPEKQNRRQQYVF